MVYIKSNYKLAAILLAAIIVLGLTLLVFALTSYNETDRIYTHIHIHGVAVGGMNQEEAVAALMERFQPGLEERRITYTVNGETTAEYTFADFGARFDFSALVESALVYSHLGNFTRRVARVFGRPHEITEPPAFAFSIQRMESILADLSKSLDEEPRNATFVEEGGYLIVKEERAGRELDKEAAATATQAALTSLSGGTVELNVEAIQPRFTVTDFDFTKSVLGYFETGYLGGDEPRSRNVRRAATRIHNQVVYPGEVFSAGAIIAAHLPDSGYEVSIVLVRGEPVEDVGGGVCQVVTTLYNAILRAELEIVQRHNHSARVSYAEMGFDATVAGDYFDLKFKNTTPHPLLIASHTRNGVLHISIYGYETRDSGRSLRFVARQVEVIQPEPYREVVDPTIPRGETYVTLEAQMGYRIELFKYVYMNGIKVEEVKINTSTYKPLQGVIAIGAG